MCLVIVDVNVAPRVLLTSSDPEFSALHRALFGKKRPNAILTYGGRLTREYRQNYGLGRVLATLDRAGRARAVADAHVDAATRLIAEGGVAASNDHHILALARVSGARILCSQDGKLRADFKKRELVNSPKGKLYSSAAHTRIILHNC